MNKEEILAMEAGPEMDKVVEEVIFGYRIGERPSPHYRWEGETVLCTLVEDKLLTEEELCHIKRVYIAQPKYSTDISAAWQVMKKGGLALFSLNNKDWACCKASHIYHVEISQDHYADPNLVICREAPEAICKAALIAKLKVRQG